MSAPDRVDWPRSQSFSVAMSAAPDDDFTNFLDLDSIDLNFPILDGNDLSLDNGAQRQQHGRGESHSFNKSQYTQQEHQYGGRDGRSDQQQWMRTEQGAQKRYPERLGSTDFDAYRQDDNWMADQNFQQHFSVPPTPNSSEMYPAQYVQQQLFQQSQRYQQYRKDDGLAAFTPHESPQFVGNDGSFSMAEFADGATFNLDPLTSPAMNPQPGSAHGSISRQQSHTAESSLAGSPAAVELEEGDHSSGMNDRPRKTRKRAAPSKSAPTSAAPKPLVATPSRKRKGSVSVKSQTRNDADASAGSQSAVLPSSNGRSSVLASDHADTTSTSASPQPQHEISMAPPPKPNSLKSTPNLRPQPTSNPDGFPPATPASLMRLQQQARSGTSSPTTNVDQQHGPMEELVLPEAANPVEPIRTDSSLSRSSTIPSTPLLNTNIPSGSLSQVASPTKFNNGSTKSSQARNSRKRNSNSSNLVSPALRPRISPSIKPLLPEGAQHNISDETHALLLASKSNYQNLLEGNHLPGVNYPSELSTNLTSKRTSHKIAEQGRRNRINTALQEMQTLLPATPTIGPGSSPNGADRSAPPEDDVGAKTPITPTQAANSKAATVELAIDYIKTLNSKLADKETENEQLRKEMADLKAKIEEAG